MQLKEPEGGLPLADVVRLHFTQAAWIEGKAIDQLHEVAALEGVRRVSAFPDLHPGKYGPVGIAVESDRLHPMLVGNDIGCGMSLFVLDLPSRKAKPERAAERLRGLEGVWDGDAAGRLEGADLAPDAFPLSLGTIGGGNHFCELQAIDRTFGKALPSLPEDATYLLVHSGSRGLGTSVLRGLPAGSGAGLDPSSEDAARYMVAHDAAVRWASLNRRIIAERAAGLLRCDLKAVCDVPHNLVEQSRGLFLHRKGAAKADVAVVPIAGSRATLSYAVAPGPDIGSASHSLSHGAGRKHDRGSMHARVGQTRSDREALTRNRWGGHIVCEDRQLLLEEAPEAYKDAGQVVSDLDSLGLASPLASFRPLVTFKRASAEKEQDRRVREKERSVARRERPGKSRR